MKLNITGASEFTRRFYEACGTYQWGREGVINSIEAGAKNIHLGIEWEAVKKLGAYRRYIADDGCGMDEVELSKFFSTLGVGNKLIGGIHKNFGVGAKIAMLPWNPKGLVVLSWKNGKASMIWIELDTNTDEYELREFQTETGATCVIDPEAVEWPEEDVDWSLVKDGLPDPFIEDHGTIVVMLGSDEYPDTVLGNPAAGENAIKGLSVYLNQRFWNLDHVKVTVGELRGDKKNAWPLSFEDKDDSRRPNNRRIQGAEYFLTKFASATPGIGKAGPHDRIMLDQGRVSTDWYLWDGKRPPIHSYAKEEGYVAVRYKDELFELSSSKHLFRRFGIIEPEVMKRLTVILTPPLFQSANGKWGIHPDQSRNRLIFTGDGEKGTTLPIDEWAEEFADELPAPILDAIKAERAGDETDALDDPEYRRRLADRFGKRWNIAVLVKAEPEDLGERVLVNPNSEIVKVYGQRKKTRTVLVKRKRKTATSKGTHAGTSDGSRGTQKQTVEQEYLGRFRDERLAAVASDNGTEEGVLLHRERDIPHIVYTHQTEKFMQPWHLALWERRDPVTGPTVFINVASPILEEIVKYHQANYPPHRSSDVEKTIQKVFGEVAACKIAHAQKLTKDGITEQELDNTYLSESALTTGLMGLIAEESLIGQRLGAIGPKKQQTAQQ